MCGIVGFTGKKNRSLTRELLETIKHRGYDESVYLHSNGINLGMNRFAIVDLSKKLYPMIYKNYILIFNGEIYNHKTLRRKLENKGLKFKTKSDAEVILPLFSMYKQKAFSMLEGMFAICIFDKKKKQIILVRDKSGQKPLYYRRNGNGFIFASELKTIISFIQKQEKRLSKKALTQYFYHGAIHNENTLLENVNRIRPSEYLIHNLKSKKIHTQNYWKPKITLKTTKATELETKLSLLLKESVEKRLMADVPVGLFISGGVDSSLISYFASKKINNIKSYSIRFPKSIKHDESYFATKVAEILNTNHTEINCTPSSIRGIFDNIEKYFDEPIVDPAVLPTAIMAKEARKKVKVVLTGEGADELFGGYYRYHKELLAEKIRNKLMLIPLPLEKQQKLFPGRFNKIFTQISDHYSPQSVWTHSQMGRLLKYKFEKIKFPKKLKKKIEKDSLFALQMIDYRGYLPEQLLMKVDKTTMIHNLEARAPYLDTKIVNFAYSLPNKFKIKGLHGKYVLKRVAQKYLPKSIVWRPKHGFSLPLEEWFRNELKDIVYDSQKDIINYKALFIVKEYKNIIKEHMDEKQDHSNKIFSIIVLMKWLKHNKIEV